MLHILIDNSAKSPPERCRGVLGVDFRASERNERGLSINGRVFLPICARFSPESEPGTQFYRISRKSISIIAENGVPISLGRAPLSGQMGRAAHCVYRGKSVG